MPKLLKTGFGSFGKMTFYGDYMSTTLFGIFHTAYERAGDEFFKFANCDYVNVLLVESNYKSNN